MKVSMNMMYNIHTTHTIKKFEEHKTNKIFFLKKSIILCIYAIFEMILNCELYVLIFYKKEISIIP